MSRVVASVLLTEREHRALVRRAGAGGLGPALIALAEKDIRAHGSEPMVLRAVPSEPVAKKLSVAIPARLADAIDDRRGTASHGAYLRALLGKREGDGEERRGEVVVRAARPLPAGWFKALLGDQGAEDAIVLRVVDAATVAEDWEQHVWSGITPGETGWLLVGVDENGHPVSLRDRAGTEREFAVLRRLFRDDPGLCSRVVLSPSIVFVRFARGKRIGEGRWVECGEEDAEGVVLVVHVEAEKVPERRRGGAA